MKKLIILVIVACTQFLFAQDITNKLGGSNQYTGYYIKNSNDDLLFEVDGVGDVTISENLNVKKIINLDWNSQGVDNGGTVNPNASYIKLYYTGLPGASFISLSTSNAIDDGSRVGQILFLEIQGISPFIRIPNGANTSIGEDRTLFQNDIIQLIFNGSVWIMQNI